MKKKQAPPPQIVTTSYLPDQLPPMRGATALFLGRSNAGKSTLLNAIFKKDLARVSKFPGKTRSVNFYRWGPKLTVVDVPGYGFAQRSREERDSWQVLMERFFDLLPEGALCLLLMDCKRDLEDEEVGLIESLWDRGLSVELLLTKADHLNQSDREGRKRALDRQCAASKPENPLTWRFVSAKTGEGIDALRRHLLHYGKEIPISAPNHDSLRP